jgi:autotransporter-associated beta strand protein
LAALFALASLPAFPVHGQTTFTESFTGTTAPGWVFGGNYTPNLTANTIDTPGNGWLRLTDNATNRSTYALLDTEIFSVNAQIQIEMDYTFWNGTGADGITFFLIDGSVNASTFAPGSYGGSLGYAQRTGTGAGPGMDGGYLGFGFDNFGNYSNPTEGRVGGTGSVSNAIAVRGPESSNWAFVNGSAALQTLPGGGQMDFPTYTTRPDQTGADYRSFRLTLDANNLLTVEMKFGASSAYITAFTADLSAYERPETFKIGFTGATGDNTEIHEIRNLSVTTTPWSTGPGAYEWDNGAGTTTWGTSAGTETNDNWYSSTIGENNKTPTPDSDILFGARPSSGPQTVNVANNVEVRNMTFDTPYDYTLNGTGTITFGDTTKSGRPSINVNNYNEDNANGRHKINNALTIVENIAIRNFSYSTLCLNGAIDLGANTLTTSGYGLTNFNGVITGSGPIIVNGSSANPATGQGIVTISGNNSSAYTGTITVNSGQLVALNNGALGTSGSATVQAINQNSSSGNTTVRVSSTVAASLSVGQEIYGAGIAPGTTIVSISTSGSNRTVTLSNALTANVSNGNSFTFVSPNAYTTINDGGTLTLRGGTTSSEVLRISGTGATLGRGEQAGAIYNDGGDNTLSGTIILTGNAAVGSRDGNLTLSGLIAGINGLTKIGDGLVTLSGSNTYTGATRIEGGALRTTTTGAMNGSSNLVLAGGVLEIAHTTTFTEGLGTAGNQLRWDGDGGFSASGANRTVNIGNTTNNLTWASTANFVGDGSALLLSSAYSANTITLGNALSFNSAQREIRVANGTAAVDAALSGQLRGGNNGTGSGGLVKTGEGTLSLSNTGNDYSGATEIRAGALRGTTGANSNVQLQGGVRELNANYTGNLGTGGGALRWLAGGGGLAADTTARTFNVGGDGQTLTWGGTTGTNNPHFVRAGDQLVLGSRSTSATLTFQNAINLNNAERTIRVIDGTAASTTPEATIAGVISNGSLAVTGNGRLDLTAANTLSGSLTVTGAEVRLSGASGAMSSASGFTVRQGGTLTLDNTSNLNTNRVGNTAGVTLLGGSVTLLGNTTTHVEDLGALTLAGGANTLSSTANGVDADLRFASLTRSVGATLDVVRNTNNGNVRFGTFPAYDDNILAYATITNTGTGAVDFVGRDDAYPGYVEPAQASYQNTGSETTWSTTSTNANTGSDQSLTAARVINSLKLSGGADITQNGFALTIESGGLLTTGGGNATTLSGGQLTTGGANELIVHAYNTVGTTISSHITGIGGLTKSGTGTLTLSGTTANTYTGATTLNSGTLVLAKSDGVAALSSTAITVGDGRGTDTLRISANEQINNAANVTLRGGEIGNTANVARLELTGAANDTFGSRVESFASLHIEGNTVLDFGGGTPCSPTFLYLDSLTVAANSLLTISSWIEFTDFLLVKKVGFDENAYSRVIFEGYGGAASWKSYDSDYYQIIPYSPVPEPATFGLLSLGALLGFTKLRRRPRTA